MQYGQGRINRTADTILAQTHLVLERLITGWECFITKISILEIRTLSSISQAANGYQEKPDMYKSGHQCTVNDAITYSKNTEINISSLRAKPYGCISTALVTPADIDQIIIGLWILIQTQHWNTLS